MLGVALAGSRLATPDEPTVVVDTPEAAAPAVPVAAPPEWLDDDLVVETDESDRRRRRWPYALLVAVLAVLVGGGAAFAYSELSVPSHTIPDLRGLTEAEARAEAEALGFEVERQESREDGSTPGDVLGTRPEAGEELDEGDTLTLIISLGNTPAPVPTDLAGKPLEEATQILAAAGGFAPEVARRDQRDGPEGRRHPARRGRAGRAAEGLGRAAGRVERPRAPHGPVRPGRRHASTRREPPSEGCS